MGLTFAFESQNNFQVKKKKIQVKIYSLSKKMPKCLFRQCLLCFKLLDLLYKASISDVTNLFLDLALS